MSPGIFRNQVLIAMQFTNDLASGATKNTLCQVVLAVAKNKKKLLVWTEERIQRMYAGNVFHFYALTSRLLH